MERRFLFRAVAYRQLAIFSGQAKSRLWRRTAECHRSILVSQHDGDDALGDRWISRVGRVRSECLVVVVDLEKYRLAIDLERPKIVFFVWVIGVAEIVVHRDGFDDASSPEPRPKKQFGAALRPLQALSLHFEARP
jgi:hypothetical protein